MTEKAVLEAELSSCFLLFCEYKELPFATDPIWIKLWQFEGVHIKLPELCIEREFD